MRGKRPQRRQSKASKTQPRPQPRGCVGAHAAAAGMRLRPPRGRGLRGWRSGLRPRPRQGRREGHFFTVLPSHGRGLVRRGSFAARFVRRTFVFRDVVRSVCTCKGHASPHPCSRLCRGQGGGSAGRLRVCDHGKAALPGVLRGGGTPVASTPCTHGPGTPTCPNRERALTCPP